MLMAAAALEPVLNEDFMQKVNISYSSFVKGGGGWGWRGGGWQWALSFVNPLVVCCQLAFGRFFV